MRPSSYSKRYQWDLLFSASLPALGFSMYSVAKVTAATSQAYRPRARPKTSSSHVLVIENEVRLSLNSLPCLCDNLKVL